MLRLYNARPRRTTSRWMIGVVAAHGVVLLALAGLATFHPRLSDQIGLAAEAEFAASQIPNLTTTATVQSPAPFRSAQAD